MSRNENLIPSEEERGLSHPTVPPEQPSSNEDEGPFYDRFWYVSQGQANLLTIPEEMENGDYYLLFYFSDTPGEDILGSKLTEELGSIRDIDDASLTFRIGRLRRFLGDDPHDPQLLQSSRIKRKMAYRLNAETAKMLEEGEEVPTWPKLSEELDEVDVFSEEIDAAQERKYGRFWYRYTTKRHVTREATETLPENMPDVPYELLDLLTLGNRAESLIQTAQLKRELEERLGTTKFMSVSEGIKWLQDWLGNPNLITKTGSGPGTEYRFNGQGKLLEPEPENAESPSLAKQATIFSVPSHVTTEPHIAQITPPETADPLRRILEGDPAIERTLRTYMEEIHPEMNENDSWKLSQVVGHFRGFSGAFTHSFIRTAVQRRILDRKALKTDATYSREDVIRLRLFHEHRDLLTKMTTKQFHRVVRLVMDDYLKEKNSPSED